MTRRRALALALALLLGGPAVAVGVGQAAAAPAPRAAPCDRTPTDLALRRPSSHRPRWSSDDDPEMGASPVSKLLPPPPYTYLLHVPDRLPAGEVPLLIAMHGLGGSSAQFAAQSEWSKTADANGFIVAFPNGLRKWDFRAASLDVAFLRSVIADVRATRCIDGRRIWATGHSMGGFMAQRLACDAGDLVAAVASTAGGNVSMPVLGGPCDAGGASPQPGYEPVAVGLWHGTADQLISYEGQGRTTQRSWVDRYGCADAPAVVQVPFGTREVHDRCGRADVTALGPPLASRFAVEFRTYADHRHGYPDGCGGLGAGGREPCATDASRWPTAESHNAEIVRYLAAHHRRSPASEAG